MAEKDFTKPRNTEVYVQGKAKWFKADRVNKFGKWSHDLYLDAESYNTMKAIKALVGAPKNIIRKDDDGYVMTFSRDPSNKWSKDAPRVFQADGTTPLIGTPVGNGSDITTKLEHYWWANKTGFGYSSALRWVSSKVDNLVAYEPDKDFDDETRRAAKGLNEQPEQLF